MYTNILPKVLFIEGLNGFIPIYVCVENLISSLNWNATLPDAIAIQLQAKVEFHFKVLL